MNNLYLKNRLVACLIACLVFTFGYSQVDVTASGGTPSASYTTLKSAFDSINVGKHTGVITIDISANTTEIASAVLNGSGAGAASYTSILIRPVADGLTISGATVSGRGLIELNGADNVTIDGDNPNTAGINKNLTLKNAATNTTTYTSVVRVALSTLINSGDNITVKNCIINGSATGRNVSTATSSIGSENTTYGIIVGGGGSTISNTTVPNGLTSVSTTISTGITAQNFNADNNTITTCGRGIACQGSSNTVFGGVNGVSITNNTIGNSTAAAVDQVYSIGITVQGFGTTATSKISGNTVYVEGYVSTSIKGIEVCGISSAGLSMLVENNQVLRVYQRSSSWWGCYGMNISGSAGANHIIRNNFIAEVNNNVTSSSASTTFGTYGLRIFGGNTYKVYHNTIRLGGAYLGGTGTATTAGIVITGTFITGVDIRNNLISVTRTGGSLTSTYTCLWLPSGATSAFNLTLNNNAYYSGSVAGQSGIAQVSTTYSAANLYLASNFNAGSTTPSTNLRAYTSTLSAAGTNDNASYASTLAAPIISATDLHLDIANTEIANVEQKADITIVLTSDIDGDVRPSAGTTISDIGADEVALPNCSAASGGTVAPSSVTKCENQTATLISTGASIGTGITYQWMVSSISGGPYLNVSGGSGANTTNYTTGALTAGTYYYVMQTTCTFGPLTGISNEVTVTVNSNPVVLVTPTTNTVCTPGGTPATLTASGASTYSWSPTLGLSPTTGATVTANPAATTVYTVTGTDAIGCSATAAATVTIANNVVFNGVTASPASICPMGTTTLTANASVTGNYCTATHSTGTGSGDYISNVQLNTLSNPTAGAPSPYYTLYPASGSTTTTLTAGTTYTLTLSPGSYSFNDLAAFMDFNQNGLLTDPGEKLGEVDDVGSFGTATIVFTVPANAVSGLTRMRIRETDHGGVNDMTPCISYSWGETEDYQVTISGGITSLSYSWSPSTYLSITTANPTVASNVASNITYTVTVTSADGCVNSDSITISTDTLSAVYAFSTPTNMICAGGSITLNSSVIGGGQPYSYMWSTGQTTSSFPDSPTTTTTYILTVADNCGDTISNSATVFVNPLPVLSVTPDTSLYCAPGTAISMTVSGATSYSWSPAAGLSSTSGSVVDASPSVSTTYTITGTDGNGCVSSITALVNKAEAVTVSSVSGNPAVLCSGNNSELIASAATAAGTYCTPAHTIGTGSGDYISSVVLNTLSNTTPGAPAPYYTLFPASGTTTTTLTAGSTYTLTLSPGTYSLNDLAAFMDFNKNGLMTDPGEKLGESDNVGSMPATTNIIFTVPATATNGNTILRIRETDHGGTNDMTPCTSYSWGETEDYVITIVGGLDALTYAWSPATYLNTTAGDTVTASVMMTSETYSVVAVSSGGCSDTGVVSITVNPTPVAPLAVDTAVCFGFGITLNASGSNTIGWYDAATGGNYLGSGASFVVPSLTATTSYFVQDSTAAGCESARTQVDVIVNPNPVVNLGTDTTRCGGSVTLDAQNAGAAYMWNNTDTTQTTTVNTSGAYIVTVTNPAGCNGMDTINVTINAIPVVALGSDTTLCTDTTLLDAQNAGSTFMWNTSATTQTIAVTGSGSYAVTVTSPQGCNGYDTINLVINPAPLVNLGSDTSLCGASLLLDAQNAGSSYVWNDASTSSINFVTSSGTYWVDVTNPQNCTTRDSIVVTISVAPVVNLGPDASVCAGDTLVLDAGTNAGASFMWNDSTTNQTLTVDTTGTYYVTATTGPNCSASDTITVTFNANPTVTLALTPASVCANASPVNLSGESPAGGMYSGTGISGNMFDPSAVTGSSAVIDYSFTDANGCTGMATDTIALVAPPSVSLSLTTDTLCQNDGVIALGGETPSGGTFSGTSVAGGSFDPTVGAGTYVITYAYTDSVTGCTGTATDNILVDVCSGAYSEMLGSANIYPNPNKGEFFIEFGVAEGNPVAELYTLQGKLVMKKQLDSATRNVMGVKELSNGIYLLRLTYEGKVKNIKITVTQ